MYKIMTKLHTSAENIYAFYMVSNDAGEIVEYSVETPEEAAEQALEILKKVGYADLRIVDDKSYYLDLIYGKKPEPVENTYELKIICPEGMTAEPDMFTEIKENSTVQSTILFSEEIISFHLIIDGKEYKTGLPKWITYESMSDTKGIFTFSGITRDHEIEIVVDEYIYSI